MNDQPGAGVPAPSSESQAFVVDLDRDLRQGALSIAGLPAITGELLRLLADDFGSNHQLARTIQREPALATRIIGMANSAAFRPVGRAPRDVSAAIARLGHDSLRCVLLAYSLAKIRSQPEYLVVREPIARLWERSIAMSSLSRGLSTRVNEVPKDAAILAGLLHAIGKIFLVARAAWYAPLLADPAGLEFVIRTWHSRAAEALLRQWDFDPKITAAVARYASPGSTQPEDRLVDVLALADSLVDLAPEESGPDPWVSVLQQSVPARRLGLAAVDAELLRTTVNEETAQMMGVLN